MANIIRFPAGSPRSLAIPLRLPEAALEAQQLIALARDTVQQVGGGGRRARVDLGNAAATLDVACTVLERGLRTHAAGAAADLRAALIDAMQMGAKPVTIRDFRAARQFCILLLSLFGEDQGSADA